MSTVYNLSIKKESGYEFITALFMFTDYGLLSTDLSLKFDVQ